MILRSHRGTAVALITLATFIDILTYSVAVPVLPDLATKFGASPTVIGLLFASFGVSLFAVSVPMGGLSDRIGRRGPMTLALVALTASTLLFAFATSLPWLFAARFVQGAADAVTWVVGFALISDLYQPSERGRVTGIVMSGTSFSVMIGPAVGGWLYELGGIRMPFIVVASVAALNAVGFLWIDMPPARRARAASLRTVFAVPAIAVCVMAGIIGSGTLSMLEPVASLFLGRDLGMSPAAIGTLFGGTALVSTMGHAVWGRLADRFGALRIMFLGLLLSGLSMPTLSAATGPWSAGALLSVMWLAIGMIVTPGLAYISSAAQDAGLESHGVVYGLYNVAWAIGLLSGPALGGWIYDRFGFQALTFLWAPMILILTGMLWRSRASRDVYAAAIRS